MGFVQNLIHEYTRLPIRAPKEIFKTAFLSNDCDWQSWLEFFPFWKTEEHSLTHVINIKHSHLIFLWGLSISGNSFNKRKIKNKTQLGAQYLRKSIHYFPYKPRWRNKEKLYINLTEDPKDKLTLKKKNRKAKGGVRFSWATNPSRALLFLCAGKRMEKKDSSIRVNLYI